MSYPLDFFSNGSYARSSQLNMPQETQATSTTSGHSNWEALQDQSTSIRQYDVFLTKDEGLEGRIDPNLLTQTQPSICGPSNSVPLPPEYNSRPLIGGINVQGSVHPNYQVIAGPRGGALNIENQAYVDRHIQSSSQENHLPQQYIYSQLADVPFLPSPNHALCDPIAQGTEIALSDPPIGVPIQNSEIEPRQTIFPIIGSRANLRGKKSGALTPQDPQAKQIQTHLFRASRKDLWGLYLAILGTEWCQAGSEEQPLPAHFQPRVDARATKKSIFGFFVTDGPKYQCRLCSDPLERSLERALGHARDHFGYRPFNGATSMNTRNDVDRRKRKNNGLTCTVCGNRLSLQNRARHEKSKRHKDAAEAAGATATVQSI